MRSALLLAVLALPGFTPTPEPPDVTADETIRRTLPFADPQAEKFLVVDNINGGITVTAHDGATVELVARRHTRARTQADLERADAEVRLEITDVDNEIILYVVQPNRSWHDRGADEPPRYGRHEGSRHESEPRYEVTFDVDLRVPRATNLDLRTINEGDIAVDGVTGHHYVKHINGGITLTDVAGSGDVYALNGDVDVTFRRLPTGDSTFGSLNGDVEVSVPPGLAATVRTKTFNGEVYTNLDLVYAPQQKADAQPTRKGTRYVYKREGFSHFRIGSGGPTLTFDAFNGDIRLIERS